MKSIAVAAAALFFAMCGHQLPHTPPPDPAGTWRVVAFWNRSSPDSPRVFLFGEQPIGYIVYDTTGHVFVEMGANPQPSRLTKAQRHALSREDLAATVEAYVASWGTYTVDAARGVVTHHVEGDTRRESIGKDQDRPFRVDGDELRIGNGTTWQRRFVRVRR